MKPVSVDTRDKCSAMTVDLKVINRDDALINRKSAMMPFQSSLYHVKTDFLSYILYVLNAIQVTAFVIVTGWMYHLK